MNAGLPAVSLILPELTAEVLLIRHGSTLANQRHQYCGRRDLPLDANGRRQAAQTGAWLQAAGIWPPGRPAVTVSSPLRRCRETALILWPQETLILDPAFQEADFGAWEGKTWAELQDDPCYRAWIDDDPLADLAPPGGESRRAVHRRVWAGFTGLLQKHPNQPLAIVTHGGVIMTLLAALTAHANGLANDPADFYRWQCQPATGFLIRADRTILPVPPA